MSDLERFRDHAATMATAVHKPECERLVTETIHRRPTFRMARPDPTCPGCVTDADRTIWKRLAAEIDVYLTTDDTALWEES